MDADKQISYDTVRMSKKDFDVFIRCFDLSMAALNEIANRSNNVHDSAYIAQRVLEFIDTHRKKP